MAARSGDARRLPRSGCAPDTVLVSYNGKCYDAPLLATRYRLARMGNPLAGLAHVDLLYPDAPALPRRAGRTAGWRRSNARRWASCAKTTCPGSEAPAAWLSYLRGGSAHNLRRVLAHNHQDVATLAALLLHLSELSAQEAESLVADAPRVRTHHTALNDPDLRSKPCQCRQAERSAHSCVASAGRGVPDENARMKIAQISPMYEAVPPKLYGGTERVVAHLCDALVHAGHEVTLFAAGDAQTRATLSPMRDQAIRLDPTPLK